MTEKKIQYNLDYSDSSFTGRDYGVSVKNPHNKPHWSLAEPFIARFALEKKEDLEKIIKNDWWKKAPSLARKLKAEGKELIFDPDCLGIEDYDGQLSIDFENEIGNRVIEILREKIEKRFGNCDLMDLNSSQILKEAHGGSDSLRAEIISNCGDESGSGPYTVEIIGPFDKSEIQFSALYGSCYDSSFGRMKRKDIPSHPSCVHTYKLLYIAKNNPELIERLEEIMKREGSEIILPFDVYKKELIKTMIDVVFAFSSGKKTKYQISKEAAKNSEMYGNYVLQKFEEGKAWFEVIPNKFIFEKDNRKIPGALRNLYKQMHRYYSDNKFEAKRLVIEFKDSPYEAIAIEYVKGNEVRRLIFSDGPPIERKMIFDDKTKPDIFYIEKLEEKPKHLNPYSQLFKPHYGKGIVKEDFDDASRRMPIFSEYRIPLLVDTLKKVNIPREIVQDYYTAIEKYFGGGYSNFRNTLFVRDGYLRNSSFESERMIVQFFLAKLKTT